MKTLSSTLLGAWLMVAGGTDTARAGSERESVARSPITTVSLREPDRVFRTARGGIARGFALVAPKKFSGRETLVLRTAAGRRLPVLSRPTGFHRDGSVRGLRLDAYLPAEFATREARFELVAGPAPPPSERVVVDDTDTTVVVATGGARFEFSRRGGDFLPRIERRTTTLKDPSRAVAFRGRCGSLRLEPTEEVAVSVAESDPLRAVVVVKCELQAEPGEPAMFATARFTFFAGVPGAEFTLRMAAARSTRFRDLGLVLPLRRATPRESFRVRCLPLGGDERSLGDAESAAVLALDGTAVIGVVGAAESPLDPACRCGLSVGGSSWRGSRLAIVGSRMRPLAPRAIELDSSGEISVLVLRGEAHLESGSELEFDGGFVLTGADDGGILTDSLVREPLPALWAVEEGAFEFVTPLASDDRDPNDPLPKLIATLDRGITALTGFRDFGDHRLGGGFANLEYDVALAFDLTAIGNHDARHLSIARDARRHFVLHDLSRGESGIPVGVPFRHGDDHRSHEVDPGHVFLGGLAFGALIDDRPRLADALGEAVAGLETLTLEPSSLALERDFAWALIAFHDAEWVLGGDRTARVRARIRAELLAAQASRGFFAIDRGRSDGFDPPLGAYVATPWLTAGVTLEALAREYVAAVAVREDSSRVAGVFTVSDDGSETDASAIARSIRRGLEFLLVDARYENGEFAARVGYDSRGEVVLGREGVADPIDRLHLAAGFGRAAWILGDRALADAFEREVVVATTRLKRLPLGPNDAARALVAWRSIVDSRSRLSRP